MKRNTMLAGLLVAIAIPLSATANDDEAALRAARAKLAKEPKVDEVVRRALEYFRVEPDRMDSLRTGARLRGLMPLLAAGYQNSDSRYVRFEEQKIFEPHTEDSNSNTRNDAFTVGAILNLPDLIFNPAEIQVYGLLGVQRDTMLEVTRVYFLRRQLYLRMLLRPPKDPIAREALQLRIDEFTSLLDVLTGGWFSKAIVSANE